MRNLSPVLWQFEHLTALYLNDNSLLRLPSDIGQLINLRMLDLSSNKLRSLPAELGELIHLRYRTCKHTNKHWNSIDKFTFQFQFLSALNWTESYCWTTICCVFCQMKLANCFTFIFWDCMEIHCKKSFNRSTMNQMARKSCWPICWIIYRVSYFLCHAAWSEILEV